MTLIFSVKPNKTIKKIKRSQLRKILRKSQPNFQHYDKKFKLKQKNGSLKKCSSIIQIANSVLFTINGENFQKE